MVEKCRWNSESEIVRWNSKTLFMEQCGGTVEQCWLNSGTVEQCGGRVKVEQCWWNSDVGRVW